MKILHSKSRGYPQRLSITLLLSFLSLYVSAQRIATSGGTYTIDRTGSNTGSNFTSFTAAITDLNQAGSFTGNVVFNVMAGQTFTELPPVITATGNAGASITFTRSGSGNNPVIEAPGQTNKEDDAAITLYGGDYFTFNGIDIHAADSSLEFGYLVRKAGNGNAARHNTITNTSILMHKLKRSVYAVFQTADSIIAATPVAYPASTAMQTNSHNTYTNIHAGNSFNGIWLKGYENAAYRDTNNTVSNNTLGSSSNTMGADGISANAFGISATWQYNAQVTNNSITHFFLQNLPSSAVSLTAINFANNLSGSITGNSISNFGTTRIAGNNANMLGYGISGAALNGTVISGNSISDLSTNVFYALYSSGTNTNVKVLNNTISGCSATGEGNGIYLTTATGCRISDNQVNNITTTATSQLYAVRVTGGANDSIDNNTIRSIAATSYVQGIYAATTNNFRIYGNLVEELSSSTNVYGINLATVSNGTRVFNNTVRGLQTSGGTAGIYGFNVNSSSGTLHFYGNLAHNISATLTGTGQVYGWYFASSAAVTVNCYNNIIYGLSKTYTGTVTATRYITGIYLAATTPATATYNLVGNAVRIDASASPNLSSQVLFNAATNTSTGPVTVLRNNLFVNATGPQSGVAKHFVIYASGTAGVFGNTGSSSNYNCFYVPHSANGFTGYSSGDKATLTDWRSTYTTFDANSISADPVFNTITNLRIMPGSPAAGTGTFVPGFTTDILGVTRHASAPSMGPYEQALDITKPSISYTKAPHVFHTGNYTLDSFAVITDAANGAINTQTGTAPRIYYKLRNHNNIFGANHSGVNGWKYTEASNTSTPFSFTIDYTLLWGPPVMPGDTVEYFIVAQDTASIPNVEARPSEGFSATSVGQVISAPSSPAYYTLLSNPAPFVSSDVIQASLSKAGQGSDNNVIIRIRVTTAGSGTSAYVSRFDLSTQGGGDDSANIESATIYYTGQSPVFSTADRFGSTSFSPTSSGTIGAFTINGNTLTTNGDNYFWLTYKLREGATIGDSVDAELISLRYNGLDEAYTGPAPSGSRTIRGEYCASSPFLPTLEDIGQVELRQKNASIFTSAGSCSPSFSNPNANRQYTDGTGLPQISILQNSAVDFSVCVTTSSAFLFGSYLGIFIDYNQNGSWEPDEIAYASKGINIYDTVFTGRFHIPCNALPGETRMRIVLKTSNSLTYVLSVADACYSNNSTSYYYGETEDYLVNIIPNPVSYLSSTAIQQTGMISSGISEQAILRIPLLAEGCGTGTLNEMYFSTTGTTNPGDLVAARLFSTGNSASFDISRQIGIVYGPNGPFTFSLLNDTLMTSAGDTNNYWLAYDISALASDNNIIDATLDSIGMLSGYQAPLVSAPAGHKTVQAPMLYTGSETFHSHTSRVTLGATHANVLGLRVITSSSGGPLAFTSLQLHTTGTTSLSDLANIKIWYTGNSSEFATVKQFGSTLPAASASHTFSGHQLLTNDTNYFWVTYDIPLIATIGHVVDAEIAEVKVNGTLYQLATPAAPGNRQIIKAYCPSEPAFPFSPGFASTMEDIGKVLLAQKGNTLLDHGVGCFPVQDNTSASGTYTDYTATAPVAGIIQNEPVDFSICAISSASMAGASAAIYIDYNQDGDFDTTERVYASSGTTFESTTFSGQFIVPCSAMPGHTRMRVILGPNLAPCSNGSYFYGETEDYIVNIIPNAPAYIYSTTIQNSNNVPPGATDAPMLRIPLVASGCGYAIASEFRFGTNGTTNVTDITNARLYSTGTSGLFATGKLLATIQNPSVSFVFSVSDTLVTNPGDTNNYWLAYDISSSAALGNRVDAVFDSVSVINGYYRPLVSDPPGSRLIDQPMTYISSTTAQNLLSRVETGSVNNPVLGLRVVTSASGSPVDITSISVSSNGTTSLSDIRNLRIWYTGTSPVFDTVTQYGSTVASPAATQNITQIMPLANDTNHFWITYDIPASATLNNAVDAEVLSITVDGTARTPAVTAPAGSRLIKAPYCVSGATNEFSVGEDIGQVTLSQHGVSILSNGSCSPAVNNSSANRSYTDFTGSVAPVDMNKNARISFSICAIKPATNSYNCYAAIYIDYNHNGLWDAGELAYASPATTNAGATFSGSFTIPCTALEGETRMRVMLVSTNPPTLNSACNSSVISYNYGETEDYTVNILASPVTYRSSTAIQHTGSVAAGTQDAVILRIPVVANGCGTATVSAFHFSTSGTSNTADIAAAKLYSTGTSSVFNTAKLVGTVNTPNGTFSFTGLSDTLKSNAPDTTYYWLAYDLSPAAQVGNVVDARADSLVIMGTRYIPAVTDPAGNRSIIVPMTYNGSVIAQQNTAKVEKGTTHANILGLRIITSSTGSPINLSSVEVSTNGTTSLSDISNLKIWYTGNNRNFATNTQFGSTVSSPAATQSISGILQLQNDTNYFWITYDIAGTAVTGNAADAEIVNFVIDGILRFPVSGSAAGAREIIAPYCTSGATSPLDDDIGNVTISNGVATLLNNGTVSPATNNPAANGQYSNFVEALVPFSITRGTSYTVAITSVFSAGTYNSTRSVYIDYNNDGDFDDAGELAWTSVPSLSSGTTTGSFIVPLNAVLGTTRMRVILIKGSTPLSSAGACLSYTFGETEDYAVNIVPEPLPVTYTWNVSASSGVFTTPGNWTPARSIPSVTDVLVINNGGNRSITGIPVQQVRSLYVGNNTTLNISGSSTLTVSDTLQIPAGSRINTGSMTLVLGTDTNRTGIFAGTGLYSGTMRRWTSASQSSYHFPLMLGNNKKHVSISYQSAPDIAGTISVNFITGNPGSAGLPLTDASLSLNIETISKEGIWDVSAGNGLSGGVFDLSIETENTPGVNNLYETVLAYRSNALSSWTLPGTSSYPIGSNMLYTLYRSGLTSLGQFTIGGTVNNPLPVSLLSFSGISAGNDVQLKWTTASETNNKGFVVERSADGKQFVNIGFVPGKSSSQATTSYTFTDHDIFLQPAATGFYYRLRQTDLDGGSTLSETVWVGKPGDLAATSQPVLFPNPFSGELFVSIHATTGSQADIEVFDISGKSMLAETFRIEPGSNTLSIRDAAGLQAGVYFAVITTNGQRQVVKLIRQ